MTRKIFKKLFFCNGNNNPQNKKFFGSADFIIAGFITAISLGLYWFTLAPAVYSGDSGEITAAIYELGVPHPTGFPLYILLANFFSRFIFWTSNFAYKTNFFSAFCGALAAGIMYFVLRKILSRVFLTESGASPLAQRALAFASSLALAFSSTLWTHSVSTNVYTASSVFIALQLLAIVYWYESRRDKFIYLYALALGFGLGTHLTAGLSAPAFFILILITDKAVLKKKNLVLKAALLAAAPLLLYFYIPWAAGKNPYVNQDNPVNLKNFIYYITQRDYSFKIGNRGSGAVFIVIGKIIKFYFFEFTALGFALAITGVAAFWSKCRKFFFALFVLMAANAFLMMSYGNKSDLFILFRYFLPSYLALAIFISLGLAFLFQKIAQIGSRKIKIFLFAALFLFPLAPLKANFFKNNQQNNFIVENYGRNLLASLPPESLFFVFGDSVSGPLWYLRGGLKERPDTIIADAALITRDWYVLQLNKRYPEAVSLEINKLPPQERLKAIIENNFDKRPIYASFNSNETIKDDYQYVPYGLVNRILEKTTAVKLEEFDAENKKLWSSYNYDGLLDEKIYKEYMVKEIAGQYAKAHNNLAVFYGNMGDKEAGRRELEEALKYDKENFPALYNLSGFYKKEGDDKKAEEYLARAKKANPDFFKSDLSTNHKIADGDFKAALPSILRKDGAVEEYLRQATEDGRRGLHFQAIEILEKAKAVNPGSEMVRFNLGTAYALTKQFLKAAAEFEKTVEINPENDFAFYNLGTIYFNELRDEEKAIGYFQKFIELKPQDPRAAQARQAILQFVKNKTKK